MRISRHYSSDHLVNDSFETRLAVYEDQIRGWFHDQARILQKVSDHAGFVLLLIITAYIESYAIFWKGEDSQNNSRAFFRDAFKDIFPLGGDGGAEVSEEIKDQVIDDIYVQVRCGLFHTGITRGKVILSTLPNGIRIQINGNAQEVIRIELNPHRMLERVEDHFARYVMRLRDPEEEELRENFDRAWNLRDL